MTSSTAFGASPRPCDRYLARQWMAAKFESGRAAPLPAARIQVVANKDPVQPDGRAGRPLRIAGETFHRGLFCHAVSNLRVHLPAPGRTFEAVIGVDSNEQTRGGRGSVVFSVEAGGRELFRSEVKREGDPAEPVAIDLGGAVEFTLRVGDAGDGICCDQADWAEARVKLADGRRVWLSDLALEDPRLPTPDGQVPLSFMYDGQSSRDFLHQWQRQYSKTPLDDNRARHVTRWQDPATGLVVRWEAIEYHDFPVVEWTVYVENEGDRDTPIISELQPLDEVFRRYAWPEGGPEEFVLHHAKGSPCTPTDYAPRETRLGKRAKLQLSAAGGRPTNTDLCYFNLQWPGQGVVLGLGWPGQWRASFQRDEGQGVRVCLGQELTHFRLHPGEEVRTPLVAMVFWSGDWLHGQNLWRSWMIAHNLPRPGGKLPPVPEFAASSARQFGEMVHADEENQKFFMRRYIEEKMKPDYWWMDAGWYVNDGGWPNTGTWEVDTKRFPHGLKAISDYAHEHGIKTIVWFEVERVTPGTWLWEKHPEWLLTCEGTGDRKLLNLGDERARSWVVEHVSRLLREQGIDLYRIDFNLDPLPYWRAKDAEDRQGITEIRYVEGLLTYLDELRQRFPDMLMDTCASGGRRNDLEMLRRAVPLHRSDYLDEPVSQQCQTYGLAFWVPFYGAPFDTVDSYAFRSVLGPHITACWDMRRQDLDYDFLRHLVAQWRKVAPYYLGDYYPLTPYTAERTAWMAWQFHRADLEAGLVQVFRRGESIYVEADLPLRGLDPEALYEVTDLDEQEPRYFSGRDLMAEGLPVSMAHRPSAALIVYRRLRKVQH